MCVALGAEGSHACAQTAGADEIVDIATLTGAMIVGCPACGAQFGQPVHADECRGQVALGPLYAGFWSSDEALAEALRASFKATGEKVRAEALQVADSLSGSRAQLRRLSPEGR